MSLLESNQQISCHKNVIEIISNGELFLHQKFTGQRQFEHLMGERNIPLKSIENFNANIAFARRLTERFQISFLNVVFPAKPVIKSQLLGTVGIQVSSIFNSQFVKESSIYPLDAIRSVDGACKQDTHYNGHGQWAVVRCILEKLNISTNNLTPIFKVKESIGDLGNMLGKETTESVSSFVGFEGLDSKIHYTNNRPAITGNTGNIVYAINTSALRNERLLIFGDSFFLQCIGVLSNIFKEVIYIRCPYLMEDCISSLSPDFVLSGLAERYLVNTVHHAKAAPFFTQFFFNGLEAHKLTPSFIDATRALFSPKNGDTYKKWIDTFDQQ